MCGIYVFLLMIVHVHVQYMYSTCGDHVHVLMGYQKCNLGYTCTWWVIHVLI